MELVVGVDLATAEVRVMATDAGGHVHGEAAVALPPPLSPQPGWYEQDANGWWPAVLTALSQLSERLGDERKNVVALSVCATSGTVVALDHHGEPLGPAILYADQRAGREAEAAQAAARDRWARLGLRVQASFGLPKWGWLLARAEIAGRAARLAHASDLVVGRLVEGLPHTDWSHALKSGYDPLREEWAGEALAALGIAVGLVPEVLPPTTAVGRLGDRAAPACGLPHSCEVRLGMTDACAAQLAAGAASPGRFVSVLGTTLVLKGVSRERVADPSGSVYSHRHPEGWWLPGGASSAGGGALRASFPGRDLAYLDELAIRHGPARCVVYPLTGRGERFPFVAPDAEGFVLGGEGATDDTDATDSTDATDEIDRYRATLEGTSFVERLGYEHLAGLGATADPPVSATGKGSGSRAWNRIRATVMGQPLLEKPAASTALGACILAAAGTLHPDLASAAEAMSAPGVEVAPVDAERDALDKNYERFLAALRDRGWLGRAPE